MWEQLKLLAVTGTVVQGIGANRNHVRVFIGTARIEVYVKNQTKVVPDLGAVIP